MVPEDPNVVAFPSYPSLYHGAEVLPVSFVTAVGLTPTEQGITIPGVTETFDALTGDAAGPPQPPYPTEVPPYPCAPEPMIVKLINETPLGTVQEVVPTLM